jgi:hypothetical protein
MPVIDLGAKFCIRHLERGLQRSGAFEVIDIGRAGQHDVFALVIHQAAQGQAVGVRVRQDFIDLRHHELIFGPRKPADLELVLLAFWHGQAHQLNGIHLQPGVGQQAGEGFHVIIRYIDIVV